jgi:hypothetical protein
MPKAVTKRNGARNASTDACLDLRAATRVFARNGYFNQSGRYRARG